MTQALKRRKLPHPRNEGRAVSCNHVRMETVVRFFQRWAELVRQSKTGPAVNADGPCQHCRKFVQSGNGIIANKSLFCSDYCAQQHNAMLQGW